MMEIVEQAVPWCTIKLPNNYKTWEVKMLGFVDDKKHYVNNIFKKLKATLDTSIGRNTYICWRQIRNE